MSKQVAALASALQSTRDRMMPVLAATFGDSFDGDFDVMLDAINTLKGLHNGPSPSVPVGVEGDVLSRALADAYAHGERRAPFVFSDCARQIREDLAQQPPAEAQPVAWADPQAFVNFREKGHLGGVYAREWMWANPGAGLAPLYAHPPPSAPVGGAKEKRWPFVESPADFAERLRVAMQEFPLLGAVRHVLIENPPALAKQPAARLGAAAALCEEAAQVLRAVGCSGAVLPEEWRWPLLDELEGTAATIRGQAQQPAAEDPPTFAVDRALAERFARVWCKETTTTRFEDLPEAGKIRCVDDFFLVLTKVFDEQPPAEAQPVAWIQRPGWPNGDSAVYFRIEDPAYNLPPNTPLYAHHPPSAPVDSERLGSLARRCKEEAERRAVESGDFFDRTGSLLMAAHRALAALAQQPAAEDALGRMYQAVTGRPAEWSSAWGYEDAVQEVWGHLYALSQQRENDDGN